MINMKSVLGMVTALCITVGAGSNEPSPAPLYEPAPRVYTPDHNFWVYQVTEIDGDEFYGTSKQYEDFPDVYFVDTDIRGGQEVEVGDWVVTVFEHDHVLEVVKINEEAEK